MLAGAADRVVVSSVLGHADFPKARLAILAGFALFVRARYAIVFLRGYRPNSDADSYYRLATALAHGHGFVDTVPFDLVHATAVRPPLYPAVVSVAFRLFGAHVGVAQAVSILAGTGAVVLGALLATRVAGARAGLAAGFVLALYPPLLANDTTVLVESLAVLLAFACILFLLDGRTVLAAGALGLLMLDRASAQWLVVVFGGWVLWRFGWRHCARFVLVALAVVAPWIVRNAVDVGGPILVATNGYNLSAQYSDEAAHDNGFVDAYFDARFAPARLAAPDEADLDRALRTHALHHLRSDPGRIAHVVATNALAWFEFQPGRNHDPEVLDGRNLGVRGWTLPLFYLVTAAGIAGLVVARRRAGTQLLVLLAGYTTVVCLGSVAVPRLRSLFDACTAVGAGIAIACVTARREAHPPEADRDADAPPKRPVRVAASAVALATAFAVTATGGLLWQDHMRSRARHLTFAALGRDTDALAVLRRTTTGTTTGATTAPPDYPRAATLELQDLARVLLGCTPDAPPSAHAQMVAAARAVRLAQHQVDVVGLLSAGELLHPAGRTPSIAVVRDVYETRVRPFDASLPAWNAVASESTLTDAQRALAALGRALTEHS